jgi:hypothetical protein
MVAAQAGTLAARLQSFDPGSLPEGQEHLELSLELRRRVPLGPEELAAWQAAQAEEAEHKRQAADAGGAQRGVGVGGRAQGNWQGLAGEEGMRRCRV